MFQSNKGFLLFQFQGNQAVPVPVKHTTPPNGHCLVEIIYLVFDVYLLQWQFAYTFDMISFKQKSLVLASIRRFKTKKRESSTFDPPSPQRRKKLGILKDILTLRKTEKVQKNVKKCPPPPLP